MSEQAVPQDPSEITGQWMVRWGWKPDVIWRRFVELEDAVRYMMSGEAHGGEPTLSLIVDPVAALRNQEALDQLRALVSRTRSEEG